MIFDRWVPRPDDRIGVEKDGLRIEFYLDSRCFPHREDYFTRDVSRESPLYIERIQSIVTGAEVSEEAAAVILRLSTETNFTPEHLERQYRKDLLSEYEDIAIRVCQFAFEQAARFVDYVRSVKGQFWLQDPMPNGLHSDLVKLSAKLQVGDSEWVRACGLGVLSFTMRRLPGAISSSDWQSIAAHMASGRKAPLIGKLLSTADLFLATGYRRAAVTEAVAALELAIASFAKAVTPEEWNERFAGRMNSKNFGKYIEDLGVRATINFFFPMIFSEEQVASTILNGCQRAVEARNTIIHQGQRDVGEDDVKDYLKSVRGLCEILAAISAREL